MPTLSRCTSGGSDVTFDDAVAILISGLVLGSLYALVASGLSLVWGTLRIFNFSHGLLLTVGAYVAWTVLNYVPEAGLLGAAIVAIPVTMAVGVLAERLLVRPFIDRAGSNLIAMVTTLAGATFGQQAIQLIWGPRFKQLPEAVSGSFIVYGTGISWHSLSIIALAPLTLFLLRAFLTRSDLGLAVRAVKQNPEAALLVGVNPGRVYSVTFAIASGLAAIAGILLGSIVFMSPTMGFDPLLRAFIVVVFGGLASLGGTIAGAYIIGLVESISVFYLGLYYTPVVLFAMMIAVMLLRPQGLFGRASQ